MTEHLDPFFDKPFPVTLAAWTPHRRSFALVEHTELNSAAVGNDAHLSSQGVYFPHDLTLGDASYCRVTAHLCDLIHIHGDE